MHSSSKMVFLNTMISFMAIVIAFSLVLLVKLYVDPNLPLVIFFIIIFFGFHLIKDLLKFAYKPVILRLQEETLKDLTEAFNRIENLLKK